MSKTKYAIWDILLPENSYLSEIQMFTLILYSSIQVIQILHTYSYGT